MPANSYNIPISEGPKDLDLPSGGKVQIRPMEVTDLIDMGIVEQMDLLGQTVQTDHIQRVKGTKKPSDRQPKKLTKAQQEEADSANMMGIMADKAKFRALTTTVDRVVARTVLQPTVRLAYDVATIMNEDGSVKDVFTPMTDQPADRNVDGVIWTDQLQFTDKMHIFGACLPGGEELKSFREGSEPAVGDVDNLAEAAD